MRGAYYNEIDPYAAQWLRNLIRAGHIAPGEVDERSIVAVRSDDLRGFAQCHFFAGIGVWSWALRRAGWGDERPVWTGSCPCQPFSVAGRQDGENDERHLAPSWLRLIEECRPAVVLGEQVAAAIRFGWIDVVFLRLEQLGYACGAIDFPACSVGAPHIRQRIYFVADHDGQGRGGLAQARLHGEGAQRHDADGCGGSGAAGGVEESEFAGLEGGECGVLEESGGRRSDPDASGSGAADVVGESDGGGFAARRIEEAAGGERAPEWGAGGDDADSPGATSGFWRDAEWLPCEDGKARPVEPGTFPLVNGAAARVGRLRAYGNALNAEQARFFIEACMRL